MAYQGNTLDFNSFFQRNQPSPLLSNTFQGMQTTTPTASTFKPNTPLNIAYGGSPTVPTGQYTSTPSKGIFSSLLSNVFGGNKNTQQNTGNTKKITTKAPVAPLTGSNGTPYTQNNTGAPMNGNSVGINMAGVSPGTPINQNTGNIPQVNNNSQIPEFSPTTQQEIQSTNQNTILGNRAQEIANSANQQIGDIGAKAQQAETGYLTAGGLTPDLQGRAATIANLAEQQKANILGGAELGLAGTGQALTGQGQTQRGLLGAATLLQPRQQGYVNLIPSHPDTLGGNAGSAAFQGGSIGQQENMGQTYTNNKATLDAINAPNTGMVDQFNSLMKENGLNQSDTTVLNALANSFNGLGPTTYPALQSGFNNIVAQYAKILGTQKFNSLLQSAKGSTINQFFDMLKNQADAVQNSIYNTGTGQTQNNETSQQTSNQSSNQSPMFGSFFSNQ